MREIKFRAWGVVSKKIYDWDFILRDKMMMSAFGLPADQCRLVWMQYTGLKDKNGKEIYEGDILKQEYLTGYSLQEVKFGLYDNGERYEDAIKGNGWYMVEERHFSRKGETKIHIEKGEINSLNPNDYPLDSYPYEVIGNIYEHPELLDALS